MKIKTPQEIAKMKIAGKVVAKILATLYHLIVPGNTGLILDKKAQEIIKENNCESNFYNYQGFPNTICVSINHQLVHGIPSNYKFANGDVVSIDVGCKYLGYHADAALTKIVGTGTKLDQKLVETTKKSLSYVVSHFKPYMKTGDIGFFVENIINKNNFEVTKTFCGHGIGTQMHEKPNIFNFGKLDTGLVLKPNMTFCVEPMVLIGTDQTKISDDGWTVFSENHQNTAHFEHTLLLTENGLEVLTDWEALL